MCANIRCARINQNGGMWRRQRVQFARGKKKDEERECDCEWFTRNVCVGVGNFIGSAIDVVNHLRMRNFNLKFCYFPSTRLPGNCALKKKREIAGGEEIVPTPSEPKDSTVNKPVVVKSPWKSHAHHIAIAIGAPKMETEQKKTQRWATCSNHKYLYDINKSKSCSKISLCSL